MNFRKILTESSLTLFLENEKGENPMGGWRGKKGKTLLQLFSSKS